MKSRGTTVDVIDKLQVVSIAGNKLEKDTFIVVRKSQGSH